MAKSIEDGSLNEDELLAVVRAAEQYQPTTPAFRATLGSGLAKLRHHELILRIRKRHRATSERRGAKSPRI